MNKKNLILSLAALILGCNTNPNYERNLANAKKLFALHGEEDIEAQKKLISKKMEAVLPVYGSKPVGYEDHIKILKGYHDAFNEIKYTADVWLPGTDNQGHFDGSVRTYGNWSGVHSLTGEKLDLNGYWYLNFDENGLIVEQGDFFDIGGMFASVVPSPFKKTKKIIENTSKNMLGKSFRYPRGIPSISVHNVVLEPGEETPTHTHPVPVVVTVIQGEMTIKFESGENVIVKAGESHVGTINKWHKAKNSGNENLIIHGVFIGEKGRQIMIPKK